jgi:sulfur-oxidizing protein SoxY
LVQSELATAAWDALMFHEHRTGPRKREAGQPDSFGRASGAGFEFVLSRRELMRIAGAAAICASAPRAMAASSVPEAIEALLAGRSGVPSSRLRLDLPPRFDYGNTVPLGVAVDGPVTEANHVRRVSVFAEGNPFPEVASFHFAPASGTASASTRIRLNAGQREVVAVAELDDGSVWLGRRTIEVAISGCGVEAGVESGDVVPRPEPRLAVPTTARRDELVEIKTMISHRMETGLRVDTAGRPIPRRIINRMVCSRDGETIFAADLSPAIAANAYLNFHIVARASAVFTFTWHEDGGAVYRASRPVAVI